MRKKIKVAIPHLVLDILEYDMDYFDMKKEKLCNIVVHELGFERLIYLKKWMPFEKSIMLYFNLNERNTQYLFQMLCENEEEVEANLIRKILSYYTNCHPSVREKIVKYNLFVNLEQAIKNKYEILIEFKREVQKIIPQKIVRDHQTGFNILITNELKFEIRNITLLKIIEK